MTVNEVAKEKVETLEREFGADRNVAELIELDHKRPRTFREFPHDGTMDHLCSVCLDERRLEEVMKRRKHLLLNELLGEVVVIRGRGYKTMRKGVVEAFRTGENSFVPGFDYEGEERTQVVEQIPRLDVIIEGERLNVWDDGLDDLNPWDREKMSTSARPCDKKYDAQTKVSIS